LLSSVHLNFDDAWVGDAFPCPTIDVPKWGPALRFCAPSRLIEEFYDEHSTELAPFIVYGSGDFHHLTALWLRRHPEPLVVVSFDNHPDWDVRPPRWACGGWVNRALELPQVQKVSVWGCGNFEYWWPARVFGNRRAESTGILEIRAWADDRPRKDQESRGAIFRRSWREQFEQFAAGLVGKSVYVTVDLDCLESGAAVTNWENGRLTVDDLVWALEGLRREGRIVAGDICGAFSKPKYARKGQRFVATMDHPRLPVPNDIEARKINHKVLERLWPILTQ